jgi:hypothetical protein
MPEENNAEIQNEFDKMVQRAKEEYPELENAISSFNSTSVPVEEYRNYLNLLNDLPYPTASNHVPIE